MLSTHESLVKLRKDLMAKIAGLRAELNVVNKAISDIKNGPQKNFSLEEGPVEFTVKEGVPVSSTMLGDIGPVLEKISGDITPPAVWSALNARYDRSSIRKALDHLVAQGKLNLVRRGKGRAPSVYTKLEVIEM